MEQKSPNVMQELSNERISNKSPNNSDPAILAPFTDDKTEITPCGSSTTTKFVIIT